MTGAAESPIAVVRWERRAFALGAILVLLSVVLLARLYVSGIQSTYAPAQIPGRLVNVNTADEAALALLQQIGPDRARRIVEHREAHGPFRAWPDLLAIEGIGPKTLESLIGQVTLADPPPPR